MNSGHAPQRNGYRATPMWFIPVAALSLFMAVASISLSATAEQQERHSSIAGEGAASVSVAGKGEAPGEPEGWELRPCCRMTGLALSPAEGTAMDETLYRLSIETALRTADDALSIQKSILTGGAAADRQRLGRIGNELRAAKHELAAQRRTLAADAAGDRAALMRNMRSADRVLGECLSIQARLPRSATSRDRPGLLRRAQFVRSRLDRARAGHTNMVAGVERTAR